MRHENARYYEQCYAADVDPQRTTAQRQQCWSAWLEHYTRGESPERIAYATRRRDALRAGQGAVPPLPGSAAPEPDPPSYAAARTAGEAVGDTGAAADGTPQLRDTAAPESAEVRARYRPPPPFGRDTACAPVCNARWEQCIIPCDGRERSCYQACQTRHRTCAASCY